MQPVKVLSKLPSNLLKLKRNKMQLCSKVENILSLFLNDSFKIEFGILSTARPVDRFKN